MSEYTRFLEEVQALDDITKATDVLGWDRATNMPSAGHLERTHQMTTLRKLAYQRGTSDEFGEMIAAAKTELNGADPDGTETRLIALVERGYARGRKLTAEIVTRSAQAEGKAFNTWVKAREENDFESFRPCLEENVAIAQEVAEMLGYEDELYDALLDGYEYQMKAAEVRAMFDAVKAETVPLLREIVENGRPVDTAILHQAYPIDKQEEFCRYIAPFVGYEFERGHLGTVVHPFMTHFSQNDVRITTRYYPDFLNPALFGTLHEAGHAIYEQGTHSDFARTPLANGTSLGLHESQSRTIENIVGRSLPFWQRHFPKLQETFPTQLGNVDVYDFYRAINKVEPSFIRVEADELTYNFHIILRFELEQALLSGDLAVKDLPTAWRDKMSKLVGIVPESDADGCLQDVHWTRAMSFGYFPTYALGGFYGAQFVEAMVEQDPTIGDKLDEGDLSGLFDWLRENVHTPGSKFPPRELIIKTTGKPLSHEAFVRYANKKFREIYEL